MRYQIKPRQGTYLLQTLHGQFIGFHCLIFFLNIDKLDSILISSGIICHILGPKRPDFHLLMILFLKKQKDYHLDISQFL